MSLQKVCKRPCLILTMLLLCYIYFVAWNHLKVQLNSILRYGTVLFYILLRCPMSNRNSTNVRSYEEYYSKDVPQIFSKNLNSLISSFWPRLFDSFTTCALVEFTIYRRTKVYCRKIISMLDLSRQSWRFKISFHQ